MTLPRTEVLDQVLSGAAREKNRSEMSFLRESG